MKLKTQLKEKELLRDKFRDLIRSVTNDSENCDGNYMKIKFNSDDDLPLNKTLNFITC